MCKDCDVNVKARVSRVSLWKEPEIEDAAVL